ncbi:MAG: hypothetical protein QXL94_06640 [Candidatus Parvarchaeum sp.]
MNEPQIRAVYTLTDVEKDNLSVLEQAKTHFSLNLSAQNFDASRTDLQNITSLMKLTLEKYFDKQDIKAQTYSFQNEPKALDFYELSQKIAGINSIDALRVLSEGIFHIYNHFARYYLGVKIETTITSSKKN